MKKSERIIRALAEQGPPVAVDYTDRDYSECLLCSTYVGLTDDPVLHDKRCAWRQAVRWVEKRNLQVTPSTEFVPPIRTVKVGPSEESRKIALRRQVIDEEWGGEEGPDYLISREYHPEPVLTQAEFWVTGDGRVLRLDEMDRDHLANTRAMVLSRWPSLVSTLQRDHGVVPLLRAMEAELARRHEAGASYDGGELG